MQTVEKAPDNEETFLEQEGEIEIAVLVSLSGLNIVLLSCVDWKLPKLSVA